VGVFVFQASETPVTYECRLDSTADNAWVPCNAGTLASPDANYSTPPLGNGEHTLWVRATDAAGNAEADPPHWTWIVAVAYLDGGVLDVGGPKLDVELLDAEEPIDTRPADVAVPEDAVDRLDTELGTDVPSAQPDTAKEDLPIVVPIDTARIDTGTLDVGARDALPPPIDLGGRNDLAGGEVAAEDAGTPGGPEPGPDTAPAVGPEPSPDTAPPVTEEDAAVVPTNEDAAVTPNSEVKVLGGGFCTISPSRTASPAAFALLALAGLALLRRRRR
jgi:MYXO-CTERM domain-containing protein